MMFMAFFPVLFVSSTSGSEQLFCYWMSNPRSQPRFTHQTLQTRDLHQILGLGFWIRFFWYMLRWDCRFLHYCIYLDDEAPILISWGLVFEVHGGVLNAFMNIYLIICIFMALRVLGQWWVLGWVCGALFIYMYLWKFQLLIYMGFRVSGLYIVYICNLACRQLPQQPLLVPPRDLSSQQTPAFLREILLWTRICGLWQYVGASRPACATQRGG